MIDFNKYAITIFFVILISSSIGCTNNQVKKDNDLQNAIEKTGSPVAITLKDRKYEIFSTETGKAIPQCKKSRGNGAEKTIDCISLNNVNITSDNTDKIRIVDFSPQKQSSGMTTRSVNRPNSSKCKKYRRYYLPNMVVQICIKY